MPTEPALLFATDCAAARIIAQSIDAELSALPAKDSPEQFESWRAEALRGPARARVVVAPWLDRPASGELLSIDASQWRTRFELPYLLYRANRTLSRLRRLAHDQWGKYPCRGGSLRVLENYSSLGDQNPKS